MFWVKSKFCSGGSCVEVAPADDAVLLRDGKLGDASPVLTIGRADWTEFLAAVPKLDRQLG